MHAVAVFDTPTVQGETVASPLKDGIKIRSIFTRLPPGSHGFHIHEAGDLRGKGCAGACAHYQKGRKQVHGESPTRKGPRHTGDLGNVRIGRRPSIYRYTLKGVKVKDLWGRSLIVHADPDDLGKGSHHDSLTTGHSGKRIACAIFGRLGSTTRKRV
jgi:superoxide dismutase, Cu-Zn family